MAGAITGPGVGTGGVAAAGATVVGGAAGDVDRVGTGVVGKLPPPPNL